MRPTDSSISARDVARFRLARHCLLGDNAGNPVSIARSICGAQAQIMTASYLQVWARNHALRGADVESALWKERSLVKTSLMRQTIHLIPTVEFSIYISALKNSRISAVLRVMKRCRIEAEEAHMLTGLIMEALSKGSLRQTAIREFVHPKVSKRVRSWMEKVWSIVRIPVSEGLLCYGSGEGNEVVFIRTDQWLGKWRLLDEQKARAELLRRYLRAYGPATLRDFCHWSGMPAPEVKPLGEALKEELHEIVLEKQPCLMLREDLNALKSAASRESCVRLLPHFDPYLLAHREKEHLLPVRYYKRVYRNQGWISPVLLVDGSIAGTWSYKAKNGRLEVMIEAFGRLSRGARAGASREAEALSEFFGAKLQAITFA